MQKTIYDRLGGKEAINAVVSRFYEKIQADKSLARFFENTNMDYLRKSQAAFMTMALGGPNEYKGANMRDAHARLVSDGLAQKHFDTVAGHLIATLREFKIPDSLIDETIAVVATTHNDVLGL